ncbi:hypothetical protein [Serratia phage vB_SmaS_Opt-169]|nr:hypothetical protein [Serratia phage vB_SmaS_Opt-169]UGO51938.1 hypothetical protein PHOOPHIGHTERS_4 [Serratia phage vB_SmaS_PhooPhighters]
MKKQRPARKERIRIAKFMKKELMRFGMSKRQAIGYAFICAYYAMKAVEDLPKKYQRLDVCDMRQYIQDEVSCWDAI